MTKKTLALPILMLALTTMAQQKKSGEKSLQTPGGITYTIIHDAPGDKLPKIGDHLQLHISTGYKDATLDTMLYSSRQVNNGNPVPLILAAPGFNGDLMEGFTVLTPGDSAVFSIAVDSMRKTGMQLMPFMQDGGKMYYQVQLVSIKTVAEIEQEQKENAANEDKTLQAYFAEHNLKPLKTASGLYYLITTPGQGNNAQSGDHVTVNYTGKLLNGNVFDSNTDPQFQHMEPFSFQLGQGKVIPGWDEGIAFLNPGTKATLFIPSGLAYGSQDRSPHIPPNSILVFDVELISSKTAQDLAKEQQEQAARQPLIDEQLLQEYFTANNLKPLKTASGLYYLITTPGKGDNAKAGDNVTVNYTGKLLNGTAFDSNIEPQFGHMEPFSFPLGQGRVIRGWDEGIVLLNPGAKATLFIPSAMAYGAQSPTPAIPPHSILVFDVELISSEASQSGQGHHEGDGHQH